MGDAILCYSNVYRYNGYYFEWHHYCGPHPLNKNGELSKKIPSGFWDMVSEFQLLSDIEKRKYKEN
jgi:hypothetical protein